MERASRVAPCRTLNFAFDTGQTTTRQTEGRGSLHGLKHQTIHVSRAEGAFSNERLRLNGPDDEQQWKQWKRTSAELAPAANARARKR